MGQMDEMNEQLDELCVSYVRRLNVECKHFQTQHACEWSLKDIKYKKVRKYCHVPGWVLCASCTKLVGELEKAKTQLLSTLTLQDIFWMTVETKRKIDAIEKRFNGLEYDD